MAAPRNGWRLGVVDATIGASSRPEALEKARTLKLAAVQVTLGHTQNGGLFLIDPELQQAYLEAARKERVAIGATYLDLVQVSCLKDSPQAREAVAKSIGINRVLKARVLMTVFFGKCEPATRAEQDYVADVFRELAPEAKKAGVQLALENLLKAEDNRRIVDRAGPDAVKICYDVGNAANQMDVDPAAEIRQLGAERICQFHFKDRGYLGEGKVNWPSVLGAVNAIGFRGIAYLETPSPSKRVLEDLERNTLYLRSLGAA